jgi:DNA modification methylase
VLTPFAGIGSELYTAVKLGRKAIGIELKPSYWRTAVDNLTELEHELAVPTLFDEPVAADV